METYFRGIYMTETRKFNLLDAHTDFLTKEPSKKSAVFFTLQISTSNFDQDSPSKWTYSLMDGPFLIHFEFSDSF